MKYAQRAPAAARQMYAIVRDFGSPGRGIYDGNNYWLARRYLREIFIVLKVVYIR